MSPPTLTSVIASTGKTLALLVNPLLIPTVLLTVHVTLHRPDFKREETRRKKDLQFENFKLLKHLLLLLLLFFFAEKGKHCNLDQLLSL